MPANAHKLFFANGSDNPSFLDELKVAETTANRLRAARDDIRAAIVGAIAGWRARIAKSDLFVDGTDRDIPRPRFRMQGSFAYNTEVLPYHRPPQQIDMDDGMFLPMRYVFANGTRRPEIASKALFQLVDGVVAELCKRNGWKHIDNKSSCVRVELSATEHVDLALYAAPDVEFSRAEEFAKRLSPSVVIDGLAFDEIAYRQVDGSQILLANRDSGWVPSNPKLLEDWYLGKVAEHGAHLRRVSRYLKAWRDFILECTGLTSVALMAIAVDVFDANPGKFDERRDDQSLLKVAASLADRLASSIPNPVVPGQRLDRDWSEEQRAAYCAAAANLHAALIDALQDQTTARGCVGALIEALSDRIPDEPSLVEMEQSDLETKGLSLPAIGKLSATAAAARASAAEAAVAPAQRTRPYYKL